MAGLFLPPLASVPSETPDTLRVVTWNIRYGIELDRALEEIRANRRLAGADVYCFQELDREDTRFLAHGLGLGGAYFAASIKAESGRVMGNAVLARWPVQQQRRISLPHGGNRWESPRAATLAEFLVGERRLRVISVHTATPLLSPAGRRRQAQAVARAAIGGAEGPIIVAGDFNTIERGDERLLHGLFRDAGFAVAPIGSESTIETWWKRWGSPHDRLDHIFARGFDVLEAGVIEGTEASDHRPVWARLRWVPDLQPVTRVSDRPPVDETP